jgi:uncharacterized protein YndB with AHSA1/START domain
LNNKLTKEDRMPDIAMQVDTTASPEATHRALTSTDGVAGWWTTRNETQGVEGQVDRFWVPDAPISWDMRVEQSDPGKLVAWRCVGGPPEWIGTEVRWTLEPTGSGGTLVIFDHTGFAEVGTMFRIVTLGWAQILGRLKQYLDTGQPAPFFTL